MKCSVGDKLYCHKDSNSFSSGRYYNIRHIGMSYAFIGDNWCAIRKEEIVEDFYTEKELRKLKLEGLLNGNS